MHLLPRWRAPEWHPSPKSKPLPISPSAGAWSTRAVRSTAAPSRHGTTAHLGVELKENIKKQWWRNMVTSREDVVGLDSSVILPREVWVASGHVGVFNDPLVECLNCHKRHRQDHLQEAYAEKKKLDNPDDVPMDVVGLPRLRHRRPVDRAARLQHDAQDLPRPGRERRGHALPAPRDRAGHLRELRERADHRRARSRRSASARSARASATRSRPATSSSAPASSSRWRWNSSSSPARTKSGTSTGSTTAWTGTPASASTRTTCACTSTRQEKLSHYSKRTIDIEYRFHFQGSEWGELEGVANRTDFDLSTHSKHSGTELNYYDQATGERYTPYVIEPAAGLTRSLMAFLVDAYTEDEAPNAKGGVDKRTVLRLDRRLAPVKAAVLPLSRNADLTPKAKDLAATAASELERRVRRRRRHRPPLPPPGRDRHTVLHHRRLRHARGPRRDRA